MRLQQTCPRCLERPSRRVLVNTGRRPPLCCECFARPRGASGLRLPGRRGGALADAAVDRIFRQELDRARLRRRGRG